MVSFQCDACADTVKKPKLDQHRQRCWASFTCLDCSTTFHGQEYKSHTSCVSEAEKYQGALYKGTKKDKQAPSTTTSAAPTPAPAPADSLRPGSPTGAGTSGIHPSRLNQVSDTSISSYPSQSYSSRGRGTFIQRGRGGFGGRGGLAGRPQASGENRLAPEGGMRSWGSSATPNEASPATTPAPLSAVNGETDAAAGAARKGDSGGGEEKQRKNGKKGDKGGTGSKANSKRPKATSTVSDEAQAEAGPSSNAPTPANDEPKSKKRKRDVSTAPAPTPSSAADTDTTVKTKADDTGVSEKALKRIRKNFSKLDNAEGAVTLSSFLERLEKGKSKSKGGDEGKSVDANEVLKGIKVSNVDGKWILSV